jgi:hypothetical protein
MGEKNPDATLRELFKSIEALIKTPDVATALAARGVNTSLAQVALDGIQAYLEGNKPRAIDDLGTVVEEIRARHEASQTRERERS